MRFWNCCAVSFQFGLDGVLKAFCGRGNGRSVHENAPGLASGDALRLGNFFERRRGAGFINLYQIRQKLIGPRSGGRCSREMIFSSPLNQRRWKMQRVRLNPAERSRRKVLTVAQPNSKLPIGSGSVDAEVHPESAAFSSFRPHIR